MTKAKKEIKTRSGVKTKKVSTHKKMEQKLDTMSIFDLKKTVFKVGLVFIGIFVLCAVLAIFNKVFIPSTFIMLSLVLFTSSYYLTDDEKNKVYIYLLFGVGMASLAYAIIYTIMNV